ncbi:MAG: cell envelope integrity protein CreD [Verrucomicrobia bacterium]|nr:cell envelope integrity protein CreD [Verrucomicrobiota bacterium]
MNQTAPTPPPQTSFSKFTESTTVKVVVIGFLILLLLIPAAMVSGLIREREGRLNGVVHEISSKWGSNQQITGPIISVPYEVVFTDDKGRQQTSIEYAHILPDELNIDGSATTETRYRGIYEAVLYNSRLTLSGSFTIPDLKTIGLISNTVHWDRAFIALGISDLKGLQEKVDITLNDAAHAMEPGLETRNVFATGISTPLTVAPAEHFSFAVSLDLNGSQTLTFVPVGRVNNVNLTSSWPSPSFTGEFLPSSREVSDDGFAASWKVLHLNRNFPQVWKGSAYKVGGSAFGVKMVIPADAYQKCTRTAKYAVMFIGFTFMAFFFSEVMKKVRVHPLQYLLIGLALVVFYTLLLSISEHLSFGKGYLVSSLATIALITGYARAILRTRILAFIVGSVLAILYAYLYVVLQLEDYALLFGSIGLFIALAIVMYLTRNINWYTVGSDPRS